MKTEVRGTLGKEPKAGGEMSPGKEVKHLRGVGCFCFEFLTQPKDMMKSDIVCFFYELP